MIVIALDAQASDATAVEDGLNKLWPFRAHRLTQKGALVLDGADEIFQKRRGQEIQIKLMAAPSFGTAWNVY